MTKLSTDPYKGVRDFYPEDQAIQNHIFSVWRNVAERYGYEEYHASVLEPAEMYSAKTNEEHATEQTYTFTDRGDRKVTLRPEMTPTVARMIAAKRRELAFPVRWFSMPNLFRYERPQRGRLREHWQLNVDLFGIPSSEAEFEVLSIAIDVMETFGAKKEDFEVILNDRRILDTLFEQINLTEEARAAVRRLIDGSRKMPADEFSKRLTEICGEGAETVNSFLAMKSVEEVKTLFPSLKDVSWLKELEELTQKLQETKNAVIRFEPSLVRGFDYYTGVVFEVFDTNEENNRSMFGGGRYDRLLELFGDEKIPAFGFGMGDATIRNFLETHSLLPAYRSPADIFVCSVEEKYRETAAELSESLRAQGIGAISNLSDKKLADQIKYADKKKIPYIVCIGEAEVTSGSYTLKDLATGVETRLSKEEIPAHIRNR